ncbi:ABC transporter permease [Chloroflexota bacterium]
MKKWLQPLATVWLGLSTHKLRSFLTMLGIIIGVASVITLMSIGKGTQANILSRIESLGSDLIFIRPGATYSGGVRGAGGGATTLTLEDAAAISEQIEGIASIAPYYSRSLQVVVGANNMNTQVIGITPGYSQAYNLSIADGALISDYDYQRGASVAVIGSGAKETLFEDADPIGQSIRMGNNVVHVIGVLESKGTSMMGLSDDSILIPLTAFQHMIGEPRTNKGDYVVSSIALTVADQNQSSDIVDEITSLLRVRHQLSIDAGDDFRISSIHEIASTLQETTQSLTLLLGAIAAIALLVGGIGVMNIMLVSVLERTREIGIRKALGARERDIWTQFLLEAASLTFAGGIIGVILGWGFSYIVSRMGLMTTLVTTDIVILAVSVSVGIGLFFGFYPAWNASRLNPIEALRSE